MWSCQTHVRPFRVNVKAFVVTQMTVQMTVHVGPIDVSRQRVVVRTESRAQLTKIVSTILQMTVTRMHPPRSMMRAIQLRLTRVPVFVFRINVRRPTRQVSVSFSVAVL